MWQTFAFKGSRCIETMSTSNVFASKQESDGHCGPWPRSLAIFGAPSTSHGAEHKVRVRAKSKSRTRNSPEMSHLDVPALPPIPQWLCAHITAILVHLKRNSSWLFHVSPTQSCGAEPSRHIGNRLASPSLWRKFGADAGVSSGALDYNLQPRIGHQPSGERGGQVTGDGHLAD